MPNDKLTFTSYLHLVVQLVLVSWQTAKSPVVLRSFKNRHLQILRRNAAFFLHTLKQQPNQLFLGRYASSFKHAELNNSVAVGASSGVEEIRAVQRKEPMRPLVGWILKRFHNARVNDIRKLPLDGIKLLS